MSLLIKALDKAQNAKAEEAQAQNAKSERVTTKQQSPDIDILVNNADLVLSLSPAPSDLDGRLGASIDESREVVGDVVSQTSAAPRSAPKQAPTNAPINTSAKSAANVFSAKGMAPKKDNQLLAIVAGLALVGLLGMGGYFYRFVDNTPEVPALPHVAQLQPQGLPQPQSQVEASQQLTASAPVVTLPPQDNGEAIQDVPSSINKLPPIITSNETVIFTPVKAKSAKNLQKAIAVSDALNADDETMIAAENEADVSEPQVIVKKTAKSKTLKFNNAIASDSASITASTNNSGVSVSKTKSQGEVSPTLMRAYEAYNAGNDNDAQKLYKQVLQHDIRNVDALLGLGAIAQRQGRVADANGWFGKVLEVEPRNNIAQVALLDNTTQSNDINSETHLKNLLAKQPDDANLHAELGNYYAAQNQWPSAQQAYFDAYRLHASANNALNLAVSLDQMGKPKLALPYYQRALELAQTGGNSIDKAALEARIAAIQ